MMKTTIFLALSLSAALVLHAQSQICDGSLGDNIFEEGNFGSGTDNILQQDPGIAPGYIYNRFTPPDDGTYTLTNNMRNWSGKYDTWLQISDNSDDPNGYMMVVNAGFSPGLFYDQEVDGLCENTLYEFSADVINLVLSIVPDHIKPNVSFLIENEERFTTGPIPQDEKWHVYGFTFTTAPGQTSVRLSLRNNAPGGIGNDLALDNITFRPCGPEAFILPEEVANICEDGDPIDLLATVVGDQYASPVFLWQRSFDEGRNWEDIPGAVGPEYTHTELSGGFYYYRYLLANGAGQLDNPRCRVNSNTKIVRVEPKYYFVTDSLCEGLAYEQAGNRYAESGIYVDSLVSLIGCDSIITLNLTILPDEGLQPSVREIDPSCHDTEDGQVIVDTVVNGTEPFIFLLTGFPPGLSGVFSGLSAGAYELSVTDRYGCTFGKEVVLASPPEFVVDLGPDLDVVLGDEVQLRPSGNLPMVSYIWDPPDLADCNGNCAVVKWYPTSNMEVSLSAFSDRGCEAEDAVGIRVRIARRIFFPNAFSPNGDGVNDVFTVFGDMPNVQAISRLSIFDRWGSLLFERFDFPPNDPGNGWNGTARGQIMPEGVYVYLAEVLFLDGRSLLFSGDLTLLR